MSCLPRLRAKAGRVIDPLPSTALAWHPVHPILVSGCSEEAILPWDLSDSRHTSEKPNFVIIARRRNFTRIVHRALSTRTANLPSCDALPGAWFKRLGADVPPARPRARIRIK